MSEMYRVSTSVGLVWAFEHTSWKHFIFKVFRGFQCVAINIESWLKICTPYLIIYSQIWLNLSSDDRQFFSTSSYGWLLLNFVYISLVLKLVQNWYKGWYYLKSRVPTRLRIVSSNTSLGGCPSYQYESVDYRCKSIYTRPTLVSTTLHLARIHQLLFGASSSQHLSKFWVELWNNQHPFRHCNPCPLMSMKVTQKICTIEFPKLEIGVWLALSYSNNFCVLWFWLSLPPYWVSWRKKNSASSKLNCTMRISTQLVNCNVGYNLWIKHLEKHQSSWHSVSAIYAKFSNKNHERW